MFPQPTPDAFRVRLPYSEVCMHLRMADKIMWVRTVGDRNDVQLLHPDGTPFSSPITSGEAGLHILPLTFEHPAPTELEIRAYHRARQRCRDCDKRVLVNTPTNDGVQDRWGRCEDCAEEMDRIVRASETAAGWDPNP